METNIVYPGTVIFLSDGGFQRHFWGLGLLHAHGGPLGSPISPDHILKEWTHTLLIITNEDDLLDWMVKPGEGDEVVPNLNLTSLIHNQGLHRYKLCKATGDYLVTGHHTQGTQDDPWASKILLCLVKVLLKVVWTEDQTLDFGVKVVMPRMWLDQYQ